MALVGDILKSALRKEMKKRTDEILKAVRSVQRSMDKLAEAEKDLVEAIDRWMEFMEKLTRKLEG